MYFRDLFFSFDGRVSRLQYWLALYAPGACIMILLFGAAKLGILRPSGDFLIVVWIVLFAIASTWASLALTVKRLHDRDKSGHWIWLFYVIPMVLRVAAFAVGFRSFFGIVLQALASVPGMWGFVEIGFLRGISGGNAYGEDPLAR
jgi:uncharacterized membrane protein YhaH (DUF805 family)